MRMGDPTPARLTHDIWGWHIDSMLDGIEEQHLDLMDDEATRVALAILDPRPMRPSSASVHAGGDAGVDGESLKGLFDSSGLFDHVRRADGTRVTGGIDGVGVIDAHIIGWHGLRLIRLDAQAWDPYTHAPQTPQTVHHVDARGVSAAMARSLTLLAANLHHIVRQATLRHLTVIYARRGLACETTPHGIVIRNGDDGVSVLDASPMWLVAHDGRVCMCTDTRALETRVDHILRSDASGSGQGD